MPVNFNGLNNNPGPQRLGATERPAAASTPAARTDPTPGPAGAADDNVNLSARARALALGQAEQQLAEQPEIDDAKVAQIRQALEDGTYKIDAGKLAQKMLEIDKSIFG